MGDAYEYPEIRMARFHPVRTQYAMLSLVGLWLPRNVRNVYDGLREQWINNNLTYLDSLLLELYHDKDHDYMSTCSFTCLLHHTPFSL